MLAKPMNDKDSVTLIRDSGIQLLDFAITLEPRKALPGEFVCREGSETPIRLIFDERSGEYQLPQPDGASATSVRPQREAVPLDESLKAFEGVWLPLPFFRVNPSRRFTDGPYNWARAQITTLDTPDEQGHTHRITLAFDTRVYPVYDDVQYLAPNEDDVRAGASFALAHHWHELYDFIDAPWVEGWVREVYEERATTALRYHSDDVAEAVTRRDHQAHYLNFLSVLNDELNVPQVKVNAVRVQEPAIKVDLVLDVGNSRTCGILIEDHKSDNQGLKQLYELQLRDLSSPTQVYTEPFESRVEFVQAEFGKQNFSVKSGRNDAFTWPTITRVGREACRMAAHRRGTEGSTGLSSPKRYLWDSASYDPGWRFNRSFVKSDREPLATAAPLTNLLNDVGEPLYRLKPEERMPVFSPNYSRSALMTFMLSEVLAQALMQINSVAQRLKRAHASAPRQLRSIILTVPPAMPKPEREIFRERMQDAIAIVWKAMGWHPADAEITEEKERALSAVPFPEVHVKWDEATCGQLVYLYNETQNNFGGRTEECFDALARPDRAEPEDKALKIASVDIGGGTTDLVITRYRLDDGVGSNVRIIPQQLFREGFKVAGDDILLDVIRLYVLPAVKRALQEAGVAQPDALMSMLFGSEKCDAEQQVLRQQLTLQVFSPLSLAILSRYEQYDPIQGGEGIQATFGELLSAPPTENVLTYVREAVARECGPSAAPFDLLDVALQVDMAALHHEFLQDINIGRSLRSLCEVLYHYHCDVLLLTGRPSRLPGIQALLKHLQPLPPNRIMPLHGYHTGSWYPFHKKGCIDDPKSTAAVGAMLCLLTNHLRLPNFYFQAEGFSDYSTVRYLGMLDSNNTVKDDNVYYRDIDLDDEAFELDEQVEIQMRGPLRLGFRQLHNARWPASPLYTLTIADKALAEKVAAGQVLSVRLRVARRSARGGSPERFEIQEVAQVGGSVVPPGKLKLKLNTLADSGLGDTYYWLDSGSVLTR